MCENVCRFIVLSRNFDIYSHSPTIPSQSLKNDEKRPFSATSFPQNLEKLKTLGKFPRITLNTLNETFSTIPHTTLHVEFGRRTHTLFLMNMTSGWRTLRGVSRGSCHGDQCVSKNGESFRTISFKLIEL